MRGLLRDEETTAGAGFDMLIEGVPFGISKSLAVTPAAEETEAWAVLLSGLESSGVLSVGVSLSSSFSNFFAFLEGCWPICDE